MAWLAVQANLAQPGQGAWRRLAPQTEHVAKGVAVE
jgi:hypothetical protein